MKFIAAFFAIAALAVAAPTAANAQIGPGTIGAPAPAADGIIAILIGFTPPIGSNKGSFAGTGWGLDEMERSRVVAP
jgi:hypothetical protein